MKRGTARRIIKKKKKIDSLPLIETAEKLSICTSELKDQYLMFRDPKNGDRQLMIYDSLEGGIHYLNKECGSFSCILLPREHTLKQSGQKQKHLCTVLNHLHLLSKNKVKRTVDKNNQSPYSVYGYNVLRGNVGMGKRDFHNLEHHNTLCKFIRRMEHHFGQYVDSCALAGMVKAKSIVNWKGLNNNNLCSAALATSKNYCSPAHTDKDFFASIHQVNINRDYEKNDPICQHFCFPQFGFAVGLRPGDVLLFNPLIYHCLSMRSEKYKEIDVHVTTAYLKTAHVGLNNNSIPLSEEQELYYAFDMGKIDMN